MICLPKPLLTGQDYAFMLTKDGIPNSYLGTEVETVLFTNPTQETVILKKGTLLGTISSISKAESKTAEVWDEAMGEIRSFFGFY